MNPPNPFSGQQPSAFPTSASGSIGTFQAKPPFRFGQPSLFGQNNTLSGKNSGFSQASSFPVASGVSHSSSVQTLGFAQTSSAGLFSGLEHTPTFAATSGPSSSSVPANPGFSFKSSTNLEVFPSTSTFGPEGGELPGSGFGKQSSPLNLWKMQSSDQYWQMSLSQRKPRARLLLDFSHFPTQLVVDLGAWPLFVSSCDQFNYQFKFYLFKTS